MDTTLLNWYQGLQLLALGPCVFIIFFLCITGKQSGKVIVPLLYFVSLASSFLLPIHEAIGVNRFVHGVLLIGQSLIPALSFLLVIEFATSAVPPFIYWMILAVPLIGGSSIIYLNLIDHAEICIFDNLCARPTIFNLLYEIFSGALTFLLTILLYQRMRGKIQKESNQSKNKYAIIIALISLNLIILLIKLLQAKEMVISQRAEIAITIVKIGFMYVVLTSVFRVFDRALEIQPVVTLRPANTQRERVLADSITHLLQQEKIYHRLDLNREMMAKKLAVTENQLSLVINKYFNCNFNLLVNNYRTNEAKTLLLTTETPITEIAFAVGFNSIPSFNRVFKQIVGSAPSEYRNAVKN